MADPIDNMIDSDTLVDTGVDIDLSNQEQVVENNHNSVLEAIAKQKALDEQQVLEQTVTVDATPSDTNILDTMSDNDGIQLDVDDGIQLDTDDGIVFNDMPDDGIVFNDISDVPLSNANDSSLPYANAQDALDDMLNSDNDSFDIQGVGYDEGNYKVVGNTNTNTNSVTNTPIQPQPTSSQPNPATTTSATTATSMENIGKAEFLSHAYNYAQNNKAIKNADGWVFHFYKDTFGSTPSDSEKNAAKLDVANNPKEAPDFFLEEVHARHQQYHQNLVLTAFQSALSKYVDDKQRKQVVNAIKKEFGKSQNQKLPKNINQNQKNHAIANKVAVAELGDYAVAKKVIDSAAKLGDANTPKEKMYSPFFKIGRDTPEAAFGKLDFGDNKALKVEFKQALDKLDKPMQVMAIQSALDAKGSQEIAVLMADSIAQINPKQSKEFIKELGINTTPDPANKAKTDSANPDAKDKAADIDANKADPATPADAVAATDKTDTKEASAKTDAKLKADPAQKAASDADKPAATTDTNTDEAPEKDKKSSNENDNADNLENGDKFTPKQTLQPNGNAGVTRTVAASQVENLANAVFGGLGGLARASAGGLWDVTKAGGRATAKAYNAAGQNLTGTQNNPSLDNTGTQQGLNAPDYQKQVATHPHIVTHQTNINNYANYMDGVRAGTNPAPIFRTPTVARAASLIFLKGLRQLSPIPKAANRPQPLSANNSANSFVNPSQKINVGYSLNGNNQIFMNAINKPAPAVTNVINSGQMFTQVNGNGVNPMSPLINQPASAVSNVVNSGQMFTQVNSNGVNGVNPMSPLINQPAPAVSNVVNSGQMFTQVNSNGVNPMSPLNSVQKTLNNAQKQPNPQQPNIVAPPTAPVKKQNYFDSLDNDSPIHKINDKAKMHLMKLNDYSNSLKKLPSDGTPLTKAQNSALTKTAHDHLNSLNSFRLSLDPTSKSDVTAFNEVKTQIIDWHKGMEDTANKHGVAKKDPKSPNSSSSKLSDSLESTGKALSNFFNSVSNTLKNLTTSKSSVNNAPKPR